MDDEGYTLRSLVRRVREYGGQISTSTLAAWAGGRSVPNDPFESATLRALELALGLDLGELTLVFPPPLEPATEPTSQRTAPMPRPLTDYAGTGTAGSARLLAAAGELQQWIRAVTGSQRLLVQAVETHYHLGPDRRPKFSKATMTVRAMHDLCDCYWFMHAFTSRGTTNVRAVDDTCRVSRRPTNHPGLEAVELVFSKTLARGEVYAFSFVVDYEYDDESADEPPFYARAFHAPIASAHLRVSFDTPPLNLYECRWDLGGISPEQAVFRKAVPIDDRGALWDLTCPPLAAYGWIWDWLEENSSQPIASLGH